MQADLFERRRRAFVLWRPHATGAVPRLVIGQFAAGNPPTLGDRREIALEQLPGHDDLWSIPADRCGLTDGQVYHYWFEVTDSHPWRDGRRILCTDPTASTVDWRLLAPTLPAPYDANDCDPASVIKFEGGDLVACDPGGSRAATAQPLPANRSQPNHRTVIYELPVSWARTNVHGDPEIGVGTFRDVRALVQADAEAANFADIFALRVGRSHVQELGVNALELLPIADSFVEREWGYATSHYFAPDHSLGFPSGHSSPSANEDLVSLVNACHALGLRFFIDVVMAFIRRSGIAPMLGALRTHCEHRR